METSVCERTVDTVAVDEARSLLNQGRTAEAWAVLGAAGDEYAAKAAQILGAGDSPFKTAVQALWDTQVGEQVRVEKWDAVAASHLTNYLNILRENDNRLPRSDAIERSYVKAAEVNGLPATIVMDVVLNDITRDRSFFGSLWDVAQYGASSPERAAAMALLLAAAAPETLIATGLFVVGGQQAAPEWSQFLPLLSDRQVLESATTAGLSQPQATSLLMGAVGRALSNNPTAFADGVFDLVVDYATASPTDPSLVDRVSIALPEGVKVTWFRNDPDMERVVSFSDGTMEILRDVKAEIQHPDGLLEVIRWNNSGYAVRGDAVVGTLVEGIGIREVYFLNGGKISYYEDVAHGLVSEELKSDGTRIYTYPKPNASQLDTVRSVREDPSGITEIGLWDGSGSLYRGDVLEAHITSGNDWRRYVYVDEYENPTGRERMAFDDQTRIDTDIWGGITHTTPYGTSVGFDPANPNIQILTNADGVTYQVDFSDARVVIIRDDFGNRVSVTAGQYDPDKFFSWDASRPSLPLDQIDFSQSTAWSEPDNVAAILAASGGHDIRYSDFGYIISAGGDDQLLSGSLTWDSGWHYDASYAAGDGCITTQSSFDANGSLLGSSQHFALGGATYTDTTANPWLNDLFTAFGANTSIGVYQDSWIDKSCSALGIDFSQGWSGLGGDFAGFDSQTFSAGGAQYSWWDLSTAKLDLSDIPYWSAGASFADWSVNSYITGALDFIGGATNHVSPLVLDLDGDGVELTHAYAENVYFDIDGDGLAERVGWVAPDDGLLARDVNGNGTIDDITELYGDDQMAAFDKLRLLDDNHDGKIDAQDTAFTDLRIWRDLNMNGRSEAGELQTLAQAGIQSLSVTEHKDDRWQNENYISAAATYTKAGGQTGEMVDAHFLNDNADSWYRGAAGEVYGSNIQIDLDAIMLPQSRGYGLLPSLHIAMSLDPALKGMMRGIVALGPDEIGRVPGMVKDLLLQWAGVRGNDALGHAESVGANIDGRVVDFLEKFTGVTWLQKGLTPAVGVNASTGVKKAWAAIEAAMTARLLIQGPLREIFPHAAYSFVSDTVTLNDGLDAIMARAQTYAQQTGAEAEAFWLTLGDALIVSKDELGLTVATINQRLSDACGHELYIAERTLLAADGVLYTGDGETAEHLTLSTRVGDAQANALIGLDRNDVLFGEGGNDILDGKGGDDHLEGGDGNDTLSGGDGNDRLEGGAGDDVLDGGAARDILRGGDGRDTLIGGAGDDNLDGGADADVIEGGDGTDQLDYNNSNAGVYINLATGEAFGGHAQGDVFSGIENVNGSNFSDTIVGDGADNFLNGERGDDQIWGGGGNDQLFGAEGADELHGEAGDDTLLGFDGAELLDGGSGNDTVSYAHPYNTDGVIVDLGAGYGAAGAAAGDRYLSIENVVGTEDGNDVLIGDDNDNILSALNGLDIMRGGGGNDTLISLRGVDHMFGGSGSDRFVFSSQDDITFVDKQAVPKDPALATTVAVEITEQIGYIHDFDVNDPDEKIDLSRQNLTEVVLRQAGADTMVELDGGRVAVLIGVSAASLTSAHFILPAGVSGVTLASPADAEHMALVGSALDNMLHGGLGDDILQAGDGADILYGGKGDDTLSGGSGDDVLIGGTGGDRLDGGAGTDTVSYQDSFEGVTVDLATGATSGGTASGDVLIGIENVNGSSFADVLKGDAGENLLSGQGGDDLLVSSGNDILEGGAGSDRFVVAVQPGGETHILDFDFDDPAEKIDLSAFALAGLTIGIIKAADGRIAISLPDNQTVVIHSAKAGQTLAAEDLTFAAGSPPSAIIRQVQGTNGTDIVVGTEFGEKLFASATPDAVTSGDIFVTGKGNDVVYTSLNQFDRVVVTRNAGDQDRIINFNNLDYWYSFIPYSEFGQSISLRSHEVARDANRNTEIDLRGFADIRSLTDLTFSTSGNDTLIALGDGQVLALANFVQNYSLYGSNPQYGVYQGVYGAMFQGFESYLTADSFLFYNGILNGDAEANTLLGGYGVDEINGGNGDDLLEGRGDADVLKGGNGADRLDGGAGNDTLTGGDGSDVFVIGKYAGTSDIITDFEFWRAGERVDLSAFAAEFPDFRTLRQYLVQDGADTRVELGNGQTLILRNTPVGQLRAEDFSMPVDDLSIVGLNDNVTFVEDTTTRPFEGLQLYSGEIEVQVDIVLGTPEAGHFDWPPLASVSLTDNGAGTWTVAGSAVAVGDLLSGLTFVPANNFNQDLSIQLVLRDGVDADVVRTVAVHGIAVNDAPIAAAKSFTTSEDNALLLSAADLMAGASDVDGDVLSLTGVGNATGGTVVLADGAVVFTPSANFSGLAGFSYTVSDGHGGSDTRHVAVAVTPVNDAPLAQHHGISTQEDTPLAISAADLLAGATDADGDTLSVTAVGNATGGSVTLENGTVLFTPAADFNGAAGFDYTVSDGHGGSTTAHVTVAVTPVNDAPLAQDKAVATQEDTSLVLAAATLLAGASDVDGDALSLVEVGNAIGGTVALNDDGNAVFTPTADFNGTASFDYTLGDGFGGTVTRTVTVDIAAVNDAPVALAKAAATLEDSSVVVLAADLLAGASDVDGDTLSLTEVANAVGGSAVLNADGDVVFTPNADFNGTASFDYTVGDGHGGFATRTVTVDVAAVNDGPVVASATSELSGEEDAVLSGQIVATDVDGDTLSYAIAANAGPAHGMVAFAADGSFTYTPSGNFNGEDTFVVEVSDGHGGIATQQVSVSITAVNDAPDVQDKAAMTLEDTSVVVLASDLLAGASDVDGDTVSLVSVGDAVGGSVVLNAAGDAVFTPEANFNGVAAFRYTVSDGHGGISIGTVSVDVTAVNDAPLTAATASLLGDEDAALSGQVVASDIDGDALSYAVADGPAHGSVNLTADGRFTYTPTANFHGGDAFTVDVSDGQGGVATQQVTVTVAPVNDAPLALAKTVAATEDTALLISAADLLAGATDVEGDTLSLTAVGNAVGGVVARNPAGDVVFTPDTDFNGMASFEYTVSDGQGGTDTRTVTVAVAAVNDTPIAQAKTATTAEDAVLVITAAQLLAGASDADGDVLSLAAVGNAVGGTVALDAQGNAVFTPAANYFGTASFDYTVNDGHGGTDTRTVALTITPVNDAPVAVTILSNQQAAEQQATSFQLPSVLFQDVEGDTFTLSARLADGTPLPAWLSFDPASRTFTGTPPREAAGSYQVEICADDGQASGTVSFTLTVAAGNYQGLTLVGRDPTPFSLVQIDNGNPEQFEIIDVNGDGMLDIVGDYANGVWLFDQAQSNWSQLLTNNVEAFQVVDITGDAVKEIVADVGQYGLWRYDLTVGNWSQLLTNDIAQLDTVKVNGIAGTVFAFGGLGVWQRSYTGAWSQILTNPVDRIEKTDWNRDGVEDIFADITGGGFAWYNGATGAWTNLLTNSVEDFQLLDLTGDGNMDAVVDLGATGLWLHQRTTGTWTQLDTGNAESMRFGNYTAGGKTDIVGDFGQFGLWCYSGEAGIWQIISSLDAQSFELYDFDGDGTDDVIADLGSNGLAVFDRPSSTWMQLLTNDVESFRVGDFNADDRQDIVSDVGAFGIWRYDRALSGADVLTGGSLDDTLRGLGDNDTLIGSGGYDRLEGGDGNDVLDGGVGNDTLVGGAGDDIIVFGRGGGIDIVDNHGRGDDNDCIQVQTGVAADQLWFQRTGNDLIMSIIGTSDSVSIADWYLGQTNHVARIELANGSTLADTQVENLVSAMAAFNPPPTGQMTLSTQQHQQLDNVIAANWQSH